MRHHNRIWGWGRAPLAVLLLAVSAVACRDLLTGPEALENPNEEQPAPGDSLGGPASLFQAVSCTVSVQTAKVDCGENEPDGQNSGPARVIMGGQNRYIQITTSNAGYNTTTQQFTMNGTVRNLIGQPIGTVDGVSLEATGVRVFFANGPIMMSGSGSVTLVNHEGLGRFTASQQPYFQYNSVLDPFELSSPKSWIFSLPPTVTSFKFTVYVAAAVQYPDGWIDVTPNPFPMEPKTSWEFEPTVRDVLGDEVLGAAVSWAVSDTMIATLTPGGLATAVRAGAATVTATSGTRVGTGTVLVSGITRHWTGAISTDWFDKNNWSDVIIPVVQDSVLIPTGMPNYPVLTGNVQVDGVEVEPSATIALSAFNLTATGDVATDLAGGINSTSGRLMLTGVSKLVRGVLPRLTVTGTYSLSGNITVSQQIRVQGGRLRSSSFRIRQNP